MLNRIVLIGRLTKDPELRYTPNGVAVASFSIAVDRSRKNAQGEKETDFFDVVAWRQLGELCANYLSKGKMAAVDGEIHIRTYEGQDGQKKRAVEVVADNVRFLSPKDSSGASGSFSSANPLGNEISFSDDDIPF
jgi:single-strand DNA-binding protein